ncbi:MAG TPA: FliA/WhiG family RNA polymerase sigma factor [Polyangiaceae bacterium]|nr:FliA/WhiG family RNA polymerase sigma factor [Polyangiaceae bacterium]
MAAVTSASRKEEYDRYMPLVRRIAIRIARGVPSTVTLDDILSAGWVGMAEALARRAEKMEESHFEAYASYRIRGAILDYLRSLDPLSRKLRGASRKITDAARTLTAKLGRLPQEEELAAELGLSLGDYQDLLGSIADAGLLRLELAQVEHLNGNEPSPEAAALRNEAASVVASAIDDLPERLKTVLGLYYQEDCSFREIGEVLGVTESRACQLHSEAVHLIRAMLEEGGERRGKKGLRKA